MVLTEIIVVSNQNLSNLFNIKLLFKGNRGGNYRGGNRGYHNNANGYQKSAQYQKGDQRQQIRSAPSSQQQ